MNKTYGRGVMDEFVEDAELALGQKFRDLPPHALDTVVLGVLVKRLETKGREIPVGLLPLLDIAQKTHDVYVRLCTEGLEPVS